MNHTTKGMNENLFHPNQRLFPKSMVNFTKLPFSSWVATVEKEVVECGQTVQVLPTRFLQSEMTFLAVNYPTAKFYQSKDILQNKQVGIRLTKPGSSLIPRDYKVLIETGIYGRITKEFNVRKNLGRKPAGKFKPLRDKMTMDGCIKTLFIICVGVAGVGGLAFCGQYLKGRLVLSVTEYLRQKRRKRFEKKRVVNKKLKSKQIKVAAIKDE